MRSRGTIKGLAAAVGLAASVVACESGDAMSPLGLERGTGPEGTGSGSAAAGAVVYVVHGINGADLDLAEALPVDVSVNGACVLEGFRFREIAGPLELPAGSYDIHVRLAGEGAACGGAVAIDAPGVPLEAGENVSIVAHLTAAGAPTASRFVNDVRPEPGQSRVAARHVAAFGPVDVWVDGSVAFAGVENGAGGTATLRPGERRIAIAVAGTQTVAWEATPVLRPFRSYTAYAVGTPGNGTFDVVIHEISTPLAGDGR